MRAQQFEITHSTRYRYASSVFLSHNLIRLAPLFLPCQRPISHTLEITPAQTSARIRKDYFGNQVVSSTIAQPHRELCVTAHSEVIIGPRRCPDPAETLPWESGRGLFQKDHSNRVRQSVEFVFTSPHVPVSSVYADYAAPSFPPRRPLLEAALDLTGRIHRDFVFDPTATTVATPLEQVLQLRRGVCQDFAHFEIACLRSMGLAARYVSGYIETMPAPGQQKLNGVDASHAWISLFCPCEGWIDIDPTNNLLPSMQHITIGWGRDYSDIAPIRGVVVGGENNPVLEVTVNVLAKGQIETEFYMA